MLDELEGLAVAVGMEDLLEVLERLGKGMLEELDQLLQTTAVAAVAGLQM
jgi:hypothetical protein